MTLGDNTTAADASASFGLELEGGTYTVDPRGGAFAGADVYGPDGNLVMTAEPDGVVNVDRKMAYVGPDGNELFHVSGQQYINKTGGDYALVDPETEDPHAMLSQNFSLAKSKWEITTADGNPIATARSQSTLIGLLRNKGSVLRRLTPCDYVITTDDGTRVGSVSKDWLDASYTVSLDDDAPVKPALVLMGMAISQLEARK